MQSHRPLSRSPPRAISDRDGRTTARPLDGRRTAGFGTSSRSRASWRMSRSGRLLPVTLKDAQWDSAAIPSRRVERQVMPEADNQRLPDSYPRTRLLANHDRPAFDYLVGLVAFALTGLGDGKASLSRADGAARHSPSGKTVTASAALLRTSRNRPSQSFGGSGRR